MSKKITDYQPLQRNPNKGNQRGVGILDQSVRELGAGRSILVDKNGIIIAGNHAQEAFVNAGIENVIEVETDGTQIVVVKRTDMDAQSTAGQKMAIMDNRAVEVGLEWDNIVLGELLEEIKASDGELDRFLQDLADEEKIDMGGYTEGDTEAQIDKAEELRVKWGVESGQLWQLGDHRIICGDCTDRVVVEKVMVGEKAVLMIADPPYNVGYEYDTTNDSKAREEYAVFCQTYLSIGKQFSAMQIITPGKANERLYEPAEWMTWYKKFGTSRGHYFKAMVTEPILLFGDKPVSKFYPTDIFEYMTDREQGLRELHTCPKPIALFEALITPMTETDELVLEMFSGSGTTLIACENLKRKCRAIEISPAYVAVAIERWHQHTGKEPKLLE